MLYSLANQVLVHEDRELTEKSIKEGVVSKSGFYAKYRPKYQVR